MVKSFPGYWPPQKPFSEERDRWVLWLPVLFGIGISIYFELKIEPPLWMGPLAVVMVALTGYAVNLINRDHGSGSAALLIAVADRRRVRGCPMAHRRRKRAHSY